MPKVSITMITYNRDKSLAAAIDSVVSQTFKDWELIIIDDGSCDDTESIVLDYLKQSLPIKYQKNGENLGVVKSRNLALSMSSGEFIAVIDSDDQWIDRDKLKKQVEFLDNRKDYVLYGGGASLIDEFGVKFSELYYAENDNLIRDKILLSNQFIHSSVMFRKIVAEECGGYGDYEVGEDYDLFLKIGLQGKMANSLEIFIKYCQQQKSETLMDKKRSAKCHQQIIKKYQQQYPHYYLALTKAYLRIFLAGL